jgi:hypothetical protein
MDAIEQLKALIEAEPQLDMDFPQVFVQPKIDTYCQGKSDVGQLLKRIKKTHASDDGDGLTRAYNELLVEFRPTLNWAFSSWDYLLTTEGIHYLSRPEGEKLYCHGHYRAFTDTDFHRLIHRVFKECLFSYESKTNGQNFIFYLKKNYWDKILQEYKKLENPPDPRQRKLTPYSYLRCVPYEFLNRYHQEKVDEILGRLKTEEREIAELYFINFYKIEEILKRKFLTLDAFQRLKEEILVKIAFLDTLVHTLLLQIERY